MVEPPDAALTQARDRLKAGDLRRAEVLFREILARNPEQPDSLHALARIALQTGRDSEAIPLLQRALALHPTAAQCHADLAVALQNTGQDESAVAAARAALKLDPRHLSALNTLGNALRAMGRPEEAAQAFQTAVAIEPAHAQLQLNFASAQRDLGRLDAALESTQRAIALAPQDADAHLQLATLLRAMQQRDEAHAAILKSLELDPNSAQAHNVAGNLLLERGETARAGEHYTRALELKPDYTEASYNLGEWWRAQGRTAEARDAYANALQNDAGFVDAAVRLAESQAQLGDAQGALDSFTHAARLRPDHPEIECGIGNAYRALGEFDEAAAAYDRVVRLQSDHADAWCNLSTVFLDSGRPTEAIGYAERALAARADFPEARWNLAQALLAQGELAEGWRQYEYRLLRPGAQELSFPSPPWTGAPLGDKALFITAEQGVGDEIMFASCLPDCLAAAGTCVVECDARLVPLFARSFPAATFIARLAHATDYPATAPLPDARIAIGSLPRFFRNRAEQFSARARYLVPDAVAVAAWRARYAALGPGLKVGISWRGGRDPLAQRTRSLALGAWAEFARVPGVQLINLQYGDTRTELDAARSEHAMEIHDWADADALKDLDGLAARIAALDLVISVDNATVHLAGAVGTPTWAMLPAAADWRWMTSGDDTPWYAALTLFRQPRAGDWAPVFDRVTAALEQRAAETGDGADFARAIDTSVAAHPGAWRQRIHAPRAARVALLNDTTHWYHWGCNGTSTAITTTLRERGYAVDALPISGMYGLSAGPRSLEEFDDPHCFRRFSAANAWALRELEGADTIVINGEGSLHGLNDYVMNLLYLAYISKTFLAKPVQLVNHSCYPDGLTAANDSEPWRLYRKVYAAADFVALREPESHGLMTQAGITATLSFDCLPLSIRRLAPAPERRGDEIVIAGSVASREGDLRAWIAFAERMAMAGMNVRVLTGASMLPAADDLAFAHALKHGAPRVVELVEADSLEWWLETLARAAVVVSGRFHHTIAAATLGTPFVLLDSNTPKNTGLARVLGSPLPLSLDAPDLAEQLTARTEDALRHHGAYAAPERRELADQLCEGALRNFAALPALGR